MYPHIMPPRCSLYSHHSNRRRAYFGLSRQRPAAAARALLTGLFLSRERARQRLLGEVNAGGLGLLYRIILDSARPELCAALHLVLGALAGGRAVLIFCKAGKDRSGLLAALILAAAGCDDEQILRDYIRWGHASWERRCGAIRYWIT